VEPSFGNAVDEQRAEIHRYRRHGGADHPEHGITDERCGGSRPCQCETLPEIFPNSLRATPCCWVGSTTHRSERQITSGPGEARWAGELKPSEPRPAASAIGTPRPQLHRRHRGLGGIGHPLMAALLTAQLDDDDTRSIAGSGRKRPARSSLTHRTGMRVRRLCGCCGHRYLPGMS
jgi:hypothetical protein